MLGGWQVRKFRNGNEDTAEVWRNVDFGYSFSDKLIQSI